MYIHTAGGNNGIQGSIYTLNIYFPAQVGCLSVEYRFGNGNWCHVLLLNNQRIIKTPQDGCCDTSDELDFYTQKNL